MKVLAIRLSCVCVFLSLLMGSSPVWSWDQASPRPQFQNDDDDDEYANEQEVSKEVNPSDGGTSRDGGIRESDVPREAAPKEAAPGVRDGGAAGVPREKEPPGGVVPPAARPPEPPAATRRPVVPAPTRAAAPAAPAPNVVGAMTRNHTLQQDRIIWELRLLWVLCGLFALSFMLLFLHFLIPVGGLRFLSKGSHLLLILGNIGLGAIIIYRFFYLGHLPGTTMHSSLLWFGFTALSAYTWQRRKYPDVYIGAGILLLIVLGAVSWVIAGRYNMPGFAIQSLYTSPWWLSSSFATYTAFGLLAAAGSWMIASAFLGLLARRNHGTGYGLKPSRWEEYRLFPSFFVFIAYPLLTLAWVGQMLWSQQYLGDITKVWTTHPRLWSVPFVWLLLTAHLFALRAPKPETSEEDEDLFDDDIKPVSSKPSKLPGFLLFLATVGGSLLFVGIHYFMTYLRTS